MAAPNEVLSWTSQDPRDPRNSTLFSSYGVLYRFSVRSLSVAAYVFSLKILGDLQTEVNAHGVNVTTLWKAIRTNKEDRVAKLEWAPNGGLGRAVIGKVKFLPGEILQIL